MGGLLLAGPFGLPTQPVVGLVAGDRRDPGPGPVGHAVERPPLDGDDERVLHRLLGRVEAAEETGQGRQRVPGLGPERRLEGEVAQPAPVKSMHGWTTTRPIHAPGILAAHVIASSMSAQSSR